MNNQDYMYHASTCIGELLSLYGEIATKTAFFLADENELFESSNQLEIEKDLALLKTLFSEKLNEASFSLRLSPFEFNLITIETCSKSIELESAQKMVENSITLLSEERADYLHKKLEERKKELLHAK